jgi:hypothetical protein
MNEKHSHLIHAKELSTYRTFRQFPDLHSSVRQISHQLKTNTSNTIKKTKRIDLNTSSLNLLKELTKSALPEINYLSTFRNEILTHHKSITATTIEKSDETTLDSFESAKHKLTMLALSFNSQGMFTILSGFHDTFMSFEFFQSQLKRCLHLHLSLQEDVALFEYLKHKERDTLDGTDFIRLLFKLGT